MITVSIIFSVIVFLEIFQENYSLAMRPTLKSDTTFGEDVEEGNAKISIERNRAAEERINLSFPGTKW